MSNDRPKVIHHDNSLNAFITGAVLGVAAALLLGTEEGRKIAKRLKDSAKEVAKDVEPYLENLPQKAQQAATEIKRVTENMTPLPPELKKPEFFARPPAAPSKPASSFTQNGRPIS